MENFRNKFLSFKLHTMVKSPTILHVLPGTPNHGHHLLWASSHQYLHGSMIQGHPEQMILLLTYYQKISSSLMLWHNACLIHLTSSHYTGIFIISSHHKEKGAWYKIRYFEKERPHDCNFHYSISLKLSYLSLIIIFNLLLCLIYKLNFFIGMCVYVCMCIYIYIYIYEKNHCR